MNTAEVTRVVRLQCLLVEDSAGNERRCCNDKGRGWGAEKWGRGLLETRSGKSFRCYKSKARRLNKFFGSWRGTQHVLVTLTMHCLNNLFAEWFIHVLLCADIFLEFIWLLKDWVNIKFEGNVLINKGCPLTPHHKSLGDPRIVFEPMYLRNWSWVLFDIDGVFDSTLK